MFKKGDTEWNFFRELYEFCERYSFIPAEDDYKAYWDDVWRDAKLLDEKYSKNTIYAARLIIAAVGALEDREQEGRNNG